MTFSWKRVYAIFEKDFKDLSKNTYVLSTLIMPLVIAFILGRGNEIPIEIHYLAINLAFTAVAAFVQCAIIAEEKEKHTLRGLMLSPATVFEIIGGKSLLSFALTAVTIVLCAKVTGYAPANLIFIGIAIIFSMFFYLALGTLLGLLSKSVMQASVIILPFIFIFSFGSSLQLLVTQTPYLQFINYLPNIQLERLAKAVEAGATMSEIAVPLTVILGWGVVTWALVVAVFKKRMTDD